MALEDLTGTTKYINSLVVTNPDGAVDPKSQGDDHIRGVKNVIKNTFPNISGVVNGTHTEINRAVSEGAPAGVLMPYTGSSAPTGWLLCYGQAVSRTTYAALFAVISTTYGVGDGSTTFNVPDLRGRAIVGKDNMGGTGANRLTGAWADSLGGADGTETHTLNTTEIPSHTHPGTTNSGGAHTHTVQGASSTGATVIGFDFITNGNSDADQLTSSDGAHTHTFTTDSSGGGGAHNNVQPSFALNYIIKT